jgi:hypothetical protein
MSVLLTRKAVLQAAMESVYNTPQAVGVNDGFLISNPMFTIKPNVLERNFVRNDLSPMPIIIGRKIASMEFETELRSNGNSNTAASMVPALITRLFRACGYALTSNRGPVVKGPYDSGTYPVEITWTPVGAGATASDVFTATAQFATGDIVHIGSKAYTFQASLTNVDGNVWIGANEAAGLANLMNAANLGPGAGIAYAAATVKQPDGVIATSTGTTLTATAPAIGASYNSVATTYTPIGSSEGSWAHATLQGGVDLATNTDVILYQLTCTVAGPSGTAQIAVTSDTLGEATAAAVVTSATPFTIGTKGLTITPVFAGSLTAGQTWSAWLMPAGWSLDPISDVFESATLVMHKDGVKHVMPGTFGTFDITAQAGNFATIKWIFTGSWVEPTDDPNPPPIFERTLPAQVQFARLQIGTFKATVEKFTFNQMNDVQIRPDVNAQDGYNGTRIVARKPEGGINPEADLVANNDFWGQFAAAQEMPFQMRVGNVAGNTVWMLAANVQYSGMTYGDRSGILVYDAGLRFARSLGNDEATFYFC